MSKQSNHSKHIHEPSVSLRLYRSDLSPMRRSIYYRYHMRQYGYTVRFEFYDIKLHQKTRLGIKFDMS